MKKKLLLNTFPTGSGQLPKDIIYFEATTEDPDHNSGEFHQHSHSFYEILFIRSGTPQYRIGNERFRLQPGDLIFIPPGVSHLPLISGSESQTYQRYILWLSTSFAQSLTPMFPENGFIHYGLLRTSGSSWHFVENCFQRGIQEIQQQRIGWSAMLLANTLELITHIYRAFMDSKSIQPPSETPQLLDQILDYIEANLSSKITLAETARHFYISESSIGALFRREMGISFYRCVTQRRLIAAKELIMQGELLEQVAIKVGFGDYSSFYRSFKAEYGISPRQLRKNQP